MPTRFSALSSTGRKGTETNQGVSDPASKTYVVKIPPVASDQAQVLDVPTPKRAIVKSVILNVIKPETAGDDDATISIGLDGFFSTGQELGADLDLASNLPAAGISGSIIVGQSLTYTLGGTDYLNFEAELVVEFTVLKTS